MLYCKEDNYLTEEFLEILRDDLYSLKVVQRRLTIVINEMQKNFNVKTIKNINEYNDLLLSLLDIEYQFARLVELEKGE